MSRALLLPLAALVLVFVMAPVTAGEGGVEVDPRLKPLARWLEGEDGVLRAMAAFELGRHDLRGSVHLAVGVIVNSQLIATNKVCVSRAAKPERQR